MNTETTVNVTSTSTENVKAKRKYTKRGTTIVARRVTLLDGKPVGRGKPSKDARGNRTVVWVPVGETYNPEVHGTGVKFNPNLAQFKRVFRRIRKADLDKIYNLSSTVAEVVA
jgi:hypothetical protein